ncbi:MAG: Rieske (2Fe-2S) domain protein, partial [Actinomycetia bacterium]|nr:Rieske (2Fe-2S) domain protein [Actinomycetes bacterium]
DPVAVRLLGNEWALVRLPDGKGATRLAAFADRCPHRFAPLSAGWVDGSSLRCGYHGWCFAADGSCTEIPALAASDRMPPRARATVPAGIVEARGMVFLAPEPPRAPLLQVPEADDDSFMHGALPVIRARVGAGLMIDNFLDMAHFPFVHAATIGTPEASVVDDFDIARDGFTMTVRSAHLFPNHEDPGVASGVRPLLQHRTLTYEYCAPFSISLRIHYEEAGGTNVLEFYVQPEDDEHCLIYTTLHRNDLDGDPHRLAEAVAFENKILDEDLKLQERFIDRRIPLDLTAEVHVRSDRMTVELRRILRDFVDAPDE